MPQIWPAVTFDTIDIDDKDGIEGEAEQDHKKWFFEMLWGLQNKTEFFYELHRIAADLNIHFKPKQIVSDFERTIFLAAKEYFPETHFQGCSFHFGQNIWRQVQKSKLAAKYGISLQIGMIKSLAFVAPECVLNYYNSLYNNLDDSAKKNC